MRRAAGQLAAAVAATWIQVRRQKATKFVQDGFTERAHATGWRVGEVGEIEEVDGVEAGQETAALAWPRCCRLPCWGSMEEKPVLSAISVN